MSLRDMASFGWNVILIFILGIVYVIGLTVQTLCAASVCAWRFIRLSFR